LSAAIASSKKKDKSPPKSEVVVKNDENQEPVLINDPAGKSFYSTTQLETHGLVLAVGLVDALLTLTAKRYGSSFVSLLCLSMGNLINFVENFCFNCNKFVQNMHRYPILTF